LPAVAQHIREEIVKPKHSLPAGYLSHFILRCELASEEVLLASLRQEILQKSYPPAQTLWVMAEMMVRRRRRDWYGILELHRHNFIGNYGVSQRLLDVFLKRFGKIKIAEAESHKDALQLLPSKTFPSSHNLTLVWTALIRLTWNWKWLTLPALYNEFLTTVKKSHGLVNSADVGTTQTLHPLPPVARFDASSFHPFLRAIGSKWHPERALQVIADMKSLGIHPTMLTWTNLAARYAFGRRADATRANRILERATAGIQNVPKHRTRVPDGNQGIGLANKYMFTTLLNIHVGRRHYPEAWFVYDLLRQKDYRTGDDCILDALIAKLFRHGSPAGRRSARRKVARGIKPNASPI
jgi:hypothetical protein